MAALLGQPEQYGTPVFGCRVSEAHDVAALFELVEDASNGGTRGTSRRLEVSRMLSIPVCERSQRRDHQVA